MRKSLIVLALAGAFGSTACTTASNSIQRVPIEPVSVEPLKSSEYLILGNVSGEATRIRWFPVFTDFFRGPITTADKAAYNAVQSIPDADALIAPRFTSETFAVPLFFTREKVTVSGKAIQIKPRS